MSIKYTYARSVRSLRNSFCKHLQITCSWLGGIEPAGGRRVVGRGNTITRNSKPQIYTSKDRGQSSSSTCHRSSKHLQKCRDVGGVCVVCNMILKPKSCIYSTMQVHLLRIGKLMLWQQTYM
jgi:hypothetical protein